MNVGINSTAALIPFSTNLLLLNREVNSYYLTVINFTKLENPFEIRNLSQGSARMADFEEPVFPQHGLQLPP